MSRHTAAVLIFLLSAVAQTVMAQINTEMTRDGNMVGTNGDNRTVMNRDTTHSNKEIPVGLKVWTVDERFGDRREAEADTLHHMFMNSIFTTGLRTQYNSTGNLGAARENRIFIDRLLPSQFIFTQPYDFFVIPVDQYHFTNTLSPITNVFYNTCGDRTNGEDHFRARFAVNASQKLGFGMKFDYIYGRGYYQEQSTAHFNYTLYGSYLGDQYQAHLLMSTNHQKVTENGGITNDDYITHPEIFGSDFRTSEIPTMLKQNWNRNDNQHLFFTHRYSLGFKRKVAMTDDEIKAKKFAMASQKEQDEKKAREEARRKGENINGNTQNTLAGRPDDAKIVGELPVDSLPPDSAKTGSGRIRVDSKAEADRLSAQQKQQEDTAWVKDEFVPVTSFIHTVKLDNYRRIFEAYDVPNNYYANTYDLQEKLSPDSIYDKTRLTRLKNTLAIALMEGFNKWAKAGLKAFVTYDLRHFTLPDSCQGGFSKYNEHSVSVGGQLSKTQGSLLHYNTTAEAWLVGEDAGQLKIDASADLNFRLFGDTVQLAARGFLHNTHPAFFFRHYHSRHLWWDNDDLSKETRLHAEGLFTFGRTHTRLRVAFDDIKNFTYYGQSYVREEGSQYDTNVGVRQHSGNLTVLTAELEQRLSMGPLNWESLITLQQTSNQDVLPLPLLNVYTNLYLKFQVARVLDVHLGADARYFTKYYAHDYSPALGQYTVQENDDRIELGNYPIVNVYANMNLKHTRFFIMMSHVNAGSGHRNYFLTPHYPLNGNILRFGLSWNFFN